MLLRLQAGTAGAKLWTMRLFFGAAGIGISVWAITVPFTKIRFHLDDATLGLILLIGGIGGVIVMPAAGLAMARWGSRAVGAGCALALAVLLPALSLAPTPAIFTILLFAYGTFFGALDIALNAQGGLIEAMSGRRQMSSFHACFSLGSLGIAIVGSLLIHAGISYVGCALVSMAAILLILTRTKDLLPRSADAIGEGPHLALPNRATIVLGLCCFVCFLTEGAATDWSTIFLRFSRGMPIASATLGYAAFAVATATTRLLGDRVAMHFGPAQLMRLGVGCALAGFALIVFVPSGIAAIIGFGLVGFGTGNIAPLVFSAASRVPGMAANHAVPAVVGLGYAGFLTGPVMIGFTANHFGLATAFGLDALLVAATFFAAKAVAA